MIDGVCQLLLHFASTDLVISTVINLPPCHSHTLRLPTKPRRCIHQCHPIRRSSRSPLATTRNNNHLPLPPRQRPLLTIHKLDHSSSSSWSLLKLRWSWGRPCVLSPSLATSSCHASSPFAAHALVEWLHSSWPVSETTPFVQSKKVLVYSKIFITNQMTNVQYGGNHGNRICYSRIWHDPVIFPVIGPSVFKRSQSECLSRDPVGQLTPV